MTRPTPLSLLPNQPRDLQPRTSVNGGRMIIPAAASAGPSPSVYFRHEHHFVYWRRLATGDIGIVTILHQRMHQMDRFRDDLGG